MNIIINDKAVGSGAATLRELAHELALPAAGVAMAVGGRMVPRAQWADTPLREGDSVIIIKATCGG